jgi:hypothetical protein
VVEEAGVPGENHRPWALSTYGFITITGLIPLKLQNNICMHCTGMSGYFDPMFVLHFELSLRCFSSTVVMQLIAYLCSTITKEFQDLYFKRIGKYLNMLGRLTAN